MRTLLKEVVLTLLLLVRMLLILVLLLTEYGLVQRFCVELVETRDAVEWRRAGRVCVRCAVQCVRDGALLAPTSLRRQSSLVNAHTFSGVPPQA